MGWFGKFFKREREEIPPAPAKAKPKPTKEKAKTPIKPLVVGETVSFDSLRRLQLRDTSPSDIESVIEHEKRLKEMESTKERDYFMILIGLGAFFFILAIALKVMSEVDMSKMFGG